MSITLTNPSTSAVTTATTKATKRDNLFRVLTGNGGANGEEVSVGLIANADTDAAAHDSASSQLSTMQGLLNAHASYTVAALTTANVSAIEDIIDDFLGGSHSEAMDVLVEAYENGAVANGSAAADLRADIQAFADAQDGNAESVETSPQLNTTASLGVAMSAGDGWTASTSGSFNLAGGSVSGGTVALSNGTMTISVGKTQHAATAAVSTMYGMDVALDTNSADNQLQATMALGGATIQVDNEMDGDDLETSSQTVGIKGSYGTMSYGLGWQADGDLGFSIGTSLGGIGLTIARVNAGTTYSMGLSATVDLGGGMTLNASNAQNSDGLQDKSLNYDALTTANGPYQSAAATTDSITDAFALKAVHKSISTVGLSYAGGGTSVSVEYQEKASTSAAGDNLVASASMMLSPTITLTGKYNKDDALTTIGATGPLGSAGTISAAMTSEGSSTLTASFKF